MNDKKIEDLLKDLDNIVSTEPDKIRGILADPTTEFEAEEEDEESFPIAEDFVDEEERLGADYDVYAGDTDTYVDFLSILEEDTDFDRIEKYLRRMIKKIFESSNSILIINTIKNMLNSSNSYIRFFVVDYFPTIIQENPVWFNYYNDEIMVWLKRALYDEDFDVSISAIRSLSSISDFESDAILILKNALNNSSFSESRYPILLNKLIALDQSEYVKEYEQSENLRLRLAIVDAYFWGGNLTGLVRMHDYEEDRDIKSTILQRINDLPTRTPIIN